MSDIRFPSSPNVFLVYYTQEEVQFYVIPEDVVAPWKAKLEASQGYMVNIDAAEENDIAEHFICNNFCDDLQASWEQYLIPNTDLISCANIQTVYNFGFYL